MNQHQGDLVCVGHILGAQGIKGWVRVFSNTSPRQAILAYSPWLLERDDSFNAVAVRGRLQGKNLIAKLDGVDDRNQAETLTGCQLFIEPRQLPALDAGEYYWSDLIGLAVENLQAEPLGVVAEMMETGADDVMVVRGDRERLIPFVMDAIVHQVDLEQRRLVIDWLTDYD